MDRATERDTNNPGSYRRRLNDAFRAFGMIDVDRLPPEVAFIFYLLTCEKVAKVMIGIDRRKPGNSQRRAAFRNIDPRPDSVIRAVKTLGCSSTVSEQDIRLIFSNDETGNKFAAFSLRTRLFHDFGPWHMKELLEHAPKLNRTMSRFLECKSGIISFLDAP
jgi:hypothetical protein